jgi:hypothetical protein
LGFRVFPKHILIRKRNLRKAKRKILNLEGVYKTGFIDQAELYVKLHGWLAYISHANTHNYAKELRDHIHNFAAPTETAVTPPEPPKITSIKTVYTAQETLALFKQGLSIEQIADQRKRKIGTVWSHLEDLIEHGHLSVRSVVSPNKVAIIRSVIKSEKEKLVTVMSRLPVNTVTFDEIACVRASLIRRARLRMPSTKKWIKRNFVTVKALQ